MTVCSGIEAVSQAWEPLGFVPVAFSEIEPFPSALLAHYWPHVPNLGNMLDIRGEDWRGKLDILWGSTPCQSLSAAGKKKGLDDPRGQLMLKFCELADEIDSPYVCWENVKGALSTQNGEAFGCLLGALAGESGPLVPSGKRWTHAGYVLGPKRNVAWRLLDAQYAGVAQRRERLFVVASPTGGADPRDILFESETFHKISPIFAEKDRNGYPIYHTEHCTRSFRAENRLIDRRFSPVAHAIAFRGRANGEEIEVGTDKAYCLRASQGGSDKAFALIDDGHTPVIRQLTVLECERLMGMADGWTAIPFGGRKIASDAVRYKSIGNSVALPDLRWIGNQILSVFNHTEA
jgi:site-specific DNA-cytosine methylase